MRNVIAQEMAPRLQPRSSLIGPTKKAKMTGVSGAPTMLIANTAPTIVQP